MYVLLTLCFETFFVFYILFTFMSVANHGNTIHAKKIFVLICWITRTKPEC